MEDKRVLRFIDYLNRHLGTKPAGNVLVDAVEKYYADELKYDWYEGKFVKLKAKNKLQGERNQ